jgi:hypothetical protein
LLTQKHGKREGSVEEKVSVVKAVFLQQLAEMITDSSRKGRRISGPAD